MQRVLVDVHSDVGSSSAGGTAGPIGPIDPIAPIGLREASGCSRKCWGIGLLEEVEGREYLFSFMMPTLEASALIGVLSKKALGSPSG